MILGALMSRGLGHVQRDVLATLDADEFERWWSVAELAAAVLGNSHRPAVESVRRAVKALAAAGLVELDLFDEMVDVRPARVDIGERLAYRPRHDANRAHLLVHLPLSVEAKREREQFLDRMVALDRRIDRGE
jgi:hypothetical protein